MTVAPYPLPIIPPEPSVECLDQAQAQALAFLESVSDHQMPGFDESAVMAAIDRLLEIEATYPPELRAKFSSPPGPDDVPF